MLIKAELTRSSCLCEGRGIKRGNEQDKEFQSGVALRIAEMCNVALRIAEMCNLDMPRKEGDREDFQYTPTAYDALQGTYPNLYALSKRV